MADVNSFPGLGRIFLFLIRLSRPTTDRTSVVKPKKVARPMACHP